MRYPVRAQARSYRQTPDLKESFGCYKCRPMTRIFDMDDRARLRERFFGATHAVLACQ